jgi:hypothetical protein
MGKRGRPPGRKNWGLRPANKAAHHASVLLELWLAGAPAVEILKLLGPLAEIPEYRAIAEECWRERGAERRYTVPVKVKTNLCRLALAYTIRLQCAVVWRHRVEAAKRTLRRQGLNDTQIAEIVTRTISKNIKPEAEPDLKKVLEIVNRRTPRCTLRRKAGSRKLRR